MRIFVDNSGYALRNLGDIAMLQVALGRLRGFWPDASFDIPTESPERLHEFCPRARPVPAAGVRQWVHAGRLPDRLGRAAQTLEQQVYRRLPMAARCMGLGRMKLRGRDTSRVCAFLEAVEAADLVIATGGGYLTDVFEEHARGVLGSLLLGAHYRKRTALLGQGLGPLRSPALRAEAAATLQSVDLITLRESRAGGPLLEELGVRPEHLITTGDDAIELAYEARQDGIGSGIGVNVRIAAYSEVDGDLLDAVRSSLQEASREHRAPLIPVPISLHEGDSDTRALQALIGGPDRPAGPGDEPQTPLDVIREIGRCRVVVTGSYHAGVFALSQGIPVVGLARSAYYCDKFMGLADQFGTGCQVVRLDDGALSNEIARAIGHAWRLAGEVRSPLLSAARRQINLGHAAYQRLYELVEGRQSKQKPH